MQLAQTNRYDGRVMGNVIINTNDIEASAYVTQSYKSKNKSYKRKADEDNSSESVKDYSCIKWCLCKQNGHYRSRCPMFSQAKELNQKSKEPNRETSQKQATVTKDSKRSDDIVFVIHEITFTSKKSPDE